MALWRASVDNSLSRYIQSYCWIVVIAGVGKGVRPRISLTRCSSFAYIPATVLRGEPNILEVVYATLRGWLAPFQSSRGRTCQALAWQITGDNLSVSHLLAQNTADVKKIRSQPDAPTHPLDSSTHVGFRLSITTLFSKQAR